MNLLDILSTSPHNFCRKWIGAAGRESGGLITSMITDRIGRHEVLLQINHDYNKIKIWDILGFLKSKQKKFGEFFWLEVKKKKPF